MAGIVTLITGAARGVRGILDADGILDDGAKELFGSTDDVLDDAARAAARQMDDLVDDAVQKTGPVVKTISATEANRTHLMTNPTHQPPYMPGTTVYQVRLTAPRRFVRVYGGDSRQVAPWVMDIDDIMGLTAEQIRDKFALPGERKLICDVEIPAGSIVEVSGAVGVLGGSGGGVQYSLIDAHESWFVNERTLS